MIKAKHVANYLLGLSDPDVGDIMSHLKLQKLVYYCQGFHLALYDKAFFADRIYAWEHGPVIKSLWHEYKDYGPEAIPKPNITYKSFFDKKQQELMGEVYEVFGQFSAWKLRNLSHSEPPWKETAKDSVITHNKMKMYFKTLIKT